MQAARQAAAGAASTLRGRLQAEAAAGRLLPEVRLSAMARRRDRRPERRKCSAGRRRSKRRSCANSHLATRAREGFCVRGRACVGRLKEPAKRRARPSPLAASSAARPEVDLRSGYSKEAPRRGRPDSDPQERARTASSVAEQLHYMHSKKGFSLLRQHSEMGLLVGFQLRLARCLTVLRRRSPGPPAPAQAGTRGAKRRRSILNQLFLLSRTRLWFISMKNPNTLWARAQRRKREDRPSDFS